MEDLIKALTILKKYIVDSYDMKYPTACEHDVLYVCVNPEDVSDEDKIELDRLGFFPDEEGYGFASFKFGSR